MTLDERASRVFGLHAMLHEHALARHDVAYVFAMRNRMGKIVSTGNITSDAKMLATSVSETFFGSVPMNSAEKAMFTRMLRHSTAMRCARVTDTAVSSVGNRELTHE
jgi:hypothetical protein